jgi:hypothetical protein
MTIWLVTAGYVGLAALVARNGYHDPIAGIVVLLLGLRYMVMALER